MIASGLPTNTTSLVFTYTVAQVLTVVLLIYQLRRDLKAVSHAKWSSELHRDGLRYGLPLAFGNLAYWGLTSIDRFVLKNISGLDELGIYSMAVSFGAVALIFQSVFPPLVTFGVQMGRRKNQSGQNRRHHAFHDRPHQRNDLPHRDFLADGDLDTAGKIHAGSIYPALVYALPPVLHADRSQRHRFERCPLDLADYRHQHRCLYRQYRPALSAGTEIGAKGAAMASATAFWLFFIFKTEFSSRLWQPLPRLKIYTNSTLCLMICLAYTWLGTRDNYIWFALAWAVGLGFLFLKYKHALFTATEKIKAKLNRSAK